MDVSSQHRSDEYLSDFSGKDKLVWLQNTIEIAWTAWHEGLIPDTINDYYKRCDEMKHKMQPKI